MSDDSARPVSARRYAHNGEDLPLADWAARLGVGVSTLAERLRRGWSVEETLGRPVRRYAASGARATHPARDLTGQRFGRLVVLGPDIPRNDRPTWRCRCDCGQETTVRGRHLRAGHTRSCGCLRDETGPPRERDPVRLTHAGRTQTAAEWAAEAGLDPNTLRIRLARGWPLTEALARPARPWRRGDGDAP